MSQNFRHLSDLVSKIPSPSPTRQQTRSGQSQLDDYWNTPVGYHPVYALTRLDTTGGAQLTIIDKLQSIIDKEPGSVTVDSDHILENQKTLIDLTAANSGTVSSIVPQITGSLNTNTGSINACITSNTIVTTDAIRSQTDRIIASLDAHFAELLLTLSTKRERFYGYSTSKPSGDWLFLRDCIANDGHVSDMTFGEWYHSAFGSDNATRPFTIFVKAFGGTDGMAARKQFIISPLAICEAGIDSPCYAQTRQYMPVGTNFRRVCGDHVVQARTTAELSHYQSVSLDFTIELH
nr:MAG: hypothetical protein 2 [Beijing sediment hepe-like virus 1]